MLIKPASDNILKKNKQTNKQIRKTCNKKWRRNLQALKRLC